MPRGSVRRQRRAQAAHTTSPPAPAPTIPAPAAAGPADRANGPYEVPLSPTITAPTAGVCGPGHHEIRKGHPAVATSFDRWAHPRCLPAVPAPFRHPIGAPYPGAAQ